MSTSPRKTYESPRQRARRAAILETTREILTTKGYDGTTIRDIASQAGVAKGTLYNIYGGKDGLIVSAIVDVRDDIGEKAFEDAGPSRGLSRVLANDRGSIAQIVDNPTYSEAVTRALIAKQGSSLLIPAVLDVPIEVQTRHLEIAQELGEIRDDVDANTLARHLVIQNWGMLLALCVDRLPADELAAFAAEAIARTVRSVALDKGIELLDRHVAAVR